METEIIHYNLKAELIHDEKGDAIILTHDDNSGNDPHMVVAHPWQLRAVCEQFGLTPASDAQAAKTIATLQRRMKVLNTRIEYLADYLCTCSDSSHADFRHETDYARATADIAAEFCTDFSSDTDEDEIQQAFNVASTPVATNDLFN
jgi:hypothetical protein